VGGWLLGRFSQTLVAVALHWAGEPAGLSTSMGEVVVGGLAAAAAA